MIRAPRISISDPVAIIPDTSDDQVLLCWQAYKRQVILETLMENNKMKATMFFSLALLASSVSLAVHAEPLPPAPGEHQMGSMGGMMMSEDKLKEKQEHLLKMHELSNKILAATDPKEKDRLKAEQLQLMKDHEKQHHMMMQQHMQQMMQNKGGMPGMQPGMGNMQHGTTPGAVPSPASH